MAFSLNGQLIASASEDGTAILWNVQQLLNLKPLTYVCDWVRDYLKTNLDLRKSDRQICN